MDSDKNSDIRSRVWFGTWNNPTVTSAEEFKELVSNERIIHAVGQLEQVKTLHLQWCITLGTPMRLSWIRKNIQPQTHWESAINPPKSRAYCRKEDSRVAGPWEQGVEPRGRVMDKTHVTREERTRERNEKILEIGLIESVK